MQTTAKNEEMRRRAADDLLALARVHEEIYGDQNDDWEEVIDEEGA